MNSEPQKIFILPGNVYASKSQYQLSTILGSCVSVCIWDKELKIGGMNHFMLPFWNGQGLASPKYGNIAIEKLIQRMKSFGSNEENMLAKVFGGGRIIQNTMNSFNIGERNIEIAYEILKEKNISVIKASTGGERGRKIIFDTFTFEIYHKFIEKTIAC